MSLTSCFCANWNKEVVRTLEFRHCNLTFVPEEVYNYEENLEELYLDSNNIKELPRSLFHCEFLKKLGCSDNELCTIPTAVATLIHLEELDISKNGIVELPDNIKCCKNLTLVEISVNPLGRLPEGFTHLINLTQLYLNDTLLDFLPANFGRLTKLKVLELRENHLQSLPKSICRLTELERLDLGQNDFKELPAVVGTLIKLTELWVDSNRLVQLPKSIGNLQDLTYFDASCNRIEFLPEETEGLRSLADLHLSRNYLQELPKNIGKLSKLTTLKIDCNQLSCLPYSMGGLTSLEELILKANDLEEIPPSIGLLRKLRYLNVDQNMLLSVPAELGSCSNISLLSLCGNYLEILPDEMGRISSLTVLNLSNNKLKYLPYSFTKLKKLQAMWLSDNQAKPMLQLQSDILETTGKRVLTCFMFPQHRREPEDNFYTSDGESFHASQWEEQRRERMQIAFNVSESENEHENSVTDRAPTPYPKEGVRHRPRMANDNDSLPWHSSPITSRNASRVRASYPKEGIKQRHRKANEDVPDGRHRLANKMNGHGINVLPSYPSVDTGRGRRDARMREAKISRPRASTSPISDSLQLFRADKEKMAKDKLRIRHSSPEKTESESEAYSPKNNNRVMGRRELKARHERGAMSDSEAFSPNKTTSPTSLRRAMIETQSDVEYGTRRHHVPSDTQSDMGFRIHRRNRNIPMESQSDVEYKVRSRHTTNRQRTRNYEEIDGDKMVQRSPDFHQFSQLNRNTNAVTDARTNLTPSGQRMPRRSGYNTDPEIDRTRRRPQVRSLKEVQDDGYVHPRDYYKLPEYSVRNSPAKTLDLRQLQGKGQLHDKGQVHDRGQAGPNVHAKTLDHRQLQGKGRVQDKSQVHGQAQVHGKGLTGPNMPSSIPGSPGVQGHRPDLSNSTQYHKTQSSTYSPGPPKRGQESMHHPGSWEGGVKGQHERQNVKAFPGHDRIQQNNLHNERGYADMTSTKSLSSPMPVRTRSTSPNKSHIPSYEEALSRRREATPPSGRSPSQSQHSSPRQPIKEWNNSPLKTHEGSYSLMRAQTQSSDKRSGHYAVRDHHGGGNQSHPQRVQDTNQGNQLRNVSAMSMERLIKPLDIGSLTEEDNRVHDVERDSGNSSNVTWSGSEPLPNGHGHQEPGKSGPRTSAGITTRKEMHPDTTENDADSALTESPSPTYSSSGLTPSPQQPHFPQSVRIPSPFSPDTKVPLPPSSPVIVPGIRPAMFKGPPPPYQARWPTRPDTFPRDSSGYASERSPSSPSSYLVDQRAPSPNSTVLAWDTSAIDGQLLPSNDNSTTTGQAGGDNSAKTIQLVIYKNPGLGFSITGGWNSPGNPYRPNDMGIFVTKIAPSGPADGTLHPGDKILEVNGRDFTNVTHDDAVNLLRSSNPVSLVVQRD